MRPQEPLSCDPHDEELVVRERPRLETLERDPKDGG